MSHMVRGNTSFTEENKDILIEAIKEAYEGGDHTIFVGQIEQGNFNEESEPLIYYKSGLGDFKPN